MSDENTAAPLERQPTLFGTCPYCLSPVDVLFDIKGRPYWRCTRCELRTFGTRTALSALQKAGWIWLTPQSSAALLAWVSRVLTNAGLQEAKVKQDD